MIFEGFKDADHKFSSILKRIEAEKVSERYSLDAMIELTSKEEFKKYEYIGVGCCSMCNNLSDIYYMGTWTSYCSECVYQHFLKRFNIILNTYKECVCYDVSDNSKYGVLEMFNRTVKEYKQYKSRKV